MAAYGSARAKLDTESRPGEFVLVEFSGEGETATTQNGRHRRKGLPIQTQ
jgi:hypothetical protein